MSNALAIATVTQTLVNVVGNALTASQVGGAQPKALRPDASGGLPNPGVNIFLYQVSPNVAARNSDLPTRRSGGSLLRRPQIGLDLHYLLTFYGDDTQLDQQRMLGAVVRQLHANPVLTHDEITTAVSGSPGFLQGSDLADQIDLVRFTPINFTLEEMSKLWSVFLKTDYVLSVAYQASVVLIETDDARPTTALPVLQARVFAEPIALPVIDAVTPDEVETCSPPAPTQITLIGRNLQAVDLAVFATPGVRKPIKLAVAGSDPTELSIDLPATLHSGVNTVTVIQQFPPASPSAGSPHVLSRSNAAPFVLRPTIIAPITVAGGVITITATPQVGPVQKVILALNQLTVSPSNLPLAFELPAEPRSQDTGTLRFDTSFTPPGAQQPVSVPSGIYLARLRVDGAESQLDTVAGGAFRGPVVTI